MKNIPPSTYELIKQLISAMDGTVTIQSVITNTGSYTLHICNTKWATQGFDITIQGNVYNIISITPNVSITVTGTTPPTPCTFTLYAPKFYHGTLSSAQQDFSLPVNNALASSDKLPMIWLHESVDEMAILDPGDGQMMNSPVDMYFMIDSNLAQWTNDDHFEQAIKPMRQLFDEFLTAIKVTGIVNDVLLKQARINDRSRWGIQAKDGSSKQVFSFPMSGCQVSMNLPFIKQNPNCC